MTTKTSKQRFDALARMGCCVCRNIAGLSGFYSSETCIHHLTGSKYRGMGMKAKDEHTIPLCHFHHQGAEGIHTLGMRVWEAKFGTQTELLEQCNNRMGYKSRLLLNGWGEQ